MLTKLSSFFKVGRSAKQSVKAELMRNGLTENYADEVISATVNSQFVMDRDWDESFKDVKESSIWKRTVDESSNWVVGKIKSNEVYYKLFVGDGNLTPEEIEDFKQNKDGLGLLKFVTDTWGKDTFRRSVWLKAAYDEKTLKALEAKYPVAANVLFIESMTTEESIDIMNAESEMKLSRDDGPSDKFVHESIREIMKPRLTSKGLSDSQADEILDRESYGRLATLGADDAVGKRDLEFLWKRIHHGSADWVRTKIVADPESYKKFTDYPATYPDVTDKDVISIHEYIVNSWGEDVFKVAKSTSDLRERYNKGVPVAICRYVDFDLKSSELGS